MAYAWPRGRGGPISHAPALGSPPRILSKARDLCPARTPTYLMVWCCSESGSVALTVSRTLPTEMSSRLVTVMGSG